MALTRLGTNSITALPAGVVDANALASGVGGKVLQTINATYNTTVSHNSTSYTDTGLTATITPSSTSNKILILINQAIGRSYTDSLLDLNLLRNATSLFDPWGNDVLYTALTQHNTGYASLSYLDTPSSISALAYKTQIRSYNTNIVYAQYSNCYSSIILMEIGA